MRKDYAFVSVYMCMCVCLLSKTTCLCLTAQKSPRKHSQQLLDRIYSTMKTFSVLASLARAANPWLSKAMCLLRALYGIVGVSYPYRCPHSVSHVSYVSHIQTSCNVSVAVMLD